MTMSPFGDIGLRTGATVAGSRESCTNHVSMCVDSGIRKPGFKYELYVCPGAILYPLNISLLGDNKEIRRPASSGCCKVRGLNVSKP